MYHQNLSSTLTMDWSTW